MASKALSKEIRGLVTTAQTKTRNRLAEAHSGEKLAIGGGGVLAAIGTAALDAHDGNREPHTFEVFGMQIPTALAAGAGLAIAGTFAGRGPIAGAMVGAGFTAINISIYRAVVDRLQEEQG
jgi:hypothetical protein